MSNRVDSLEMSQVDGSAELMMNMACIMITMLMIFLPLVHFEQLIYMDNEVRDAKEDVLAPDAAEMALVQVNIDEQGNPRFHWQAVGRHQGRVIPSLAEILDLVDRERPQAIRLRMDKKVEHGIFAELLGACSTRGIELYQSLAQGSGEGK